MCRLKLRKLALAEVYEVSFWMMLHDAPTPKPTTCYSPMQTVASLDLGKLTKTERERRTNFTTVCVLPAFTETCPIYSLNPTSYIFTL